MECRKGRNPKSFKSSQTTWCLSTTDEYLHPVSLRRWIALDMMRTQPRKPPPSFLWTFLLFHTLIVMASDLPMYLPANSQRENRWISFKQSQCFESIGSYRSKCWFHFGSNDDLQVSVLWHWPEPSTITLANGSGRRKRSFFARFFAHRTFVGGQNRKISLISENLSTCYF